ncbi:MAG: pyrimidine 5'-nucleotidase [Geminicoccaceae bacterium]
MAGPALNAIETWVFDLDNTLYEASTDLFTQVQARIITFLRERFGLDEQQALAMRKELFRGHGTTLRGLMREHDVQPEAFLAYVHDVDFSVLEARPDLAAAIAALPGRKLVFTNADIAYARRVLARLGFDDLFDGVFGIVESGYAPKPQRAAFDRFIETYRFDPARALMAEDMAINLVPAHALGMTTLWVETDEVFAREGADLAHIHHRTRDLAAWLREVVTVR